jgi:hypothetical protein
LTSNLNEKVATPITIKVACNRKASTSPLLNLGYRENRRNVKIAMLDAAS